MVRILLLLLFFVFFQTSVRAQDSDRGLVCGVLAAQHKPSAGVAYQPGVDVRGKEVVPADLNASPIMPPEVIKIPLTIDLSKRIQSLSDQPLNTDSALGMIEVHQDGRVIYNGQDVGAPLKTACGLIKAEPQPQTQKTVVEKKEKTSESSVAPVNTVTKIITHQPDLIPDGIAEVIEGGEYRE